MLTLIRATLEDADLIWQMQRAAFQPLLEKYQDFDLNPAAEPVDKVIMRLKQPFTYYYLIQSDSHSIGAIRVVDKREPGKRKRISPLFILPQHQGRGFAQQAILAAERLHGSHGWELDTIAQEAGNCHLYEKLGYRATGAAARINDRMTLILYEKK